MAWRYVFNEKTQKFSKETIDQKDPLEKGEVEIEPRSVGICGSDVNRLVHNVEEPPLGHEWVGVVKNSQSTQFSQGDIVTSVAHISCGECDHCLKGDFSSCTRRLLLGGRGAPTLFCDSLILREDDLLKLSYKKTDHLKKLSLLEVSFIGDCAYFQAKRIGLAEKDSVVVFGAGAVGLSAALSFRERGHEVTIVELHEKRLEMAKKMNFSTLHFSKALVEANHFRSFDLAIDCTGDSYGKGALQVVPKFVKHHGKVVIVGKYQDAMIREKDYSDFSIALSWVANHQHKDYRESLSFWEKRLDKIPNEWQKFFSLEDINLAFEAAKTREHIKCCILLNQDQAQN